MSRGSQTSTGTTCSACGTGGGTSVDTRAPARVVRYLRHDRVPSVGCRPKRGSPLRPPYLHRPPSDLGERPWSCSFPSSHASIAWDAERSASARRRLLGGWGAARRARQRRPASVTTAAAERLRSTPLSDAHQRCSDETLLRGHPVGRQAIPARGSVLTGFHERA